LLTTNDTLKKRNRLEKKFNSFLRTTTRQKIINCGKTLKENERQTQLLNLRMRFAVQNL
jgi:hypothetical protein